MNYKPYICTLIGALVCLAGCKKTDKNEPATKMVAGNYVDLGVRTDYKLLRLSTRYANGDSNYYRFSYNTVGMVDTIFFSNTTKGRGAGYNDIHRYYYIEYDSKNWPSKIAITPFDPQGKATTSLVKYNEEKGLVMQITSESGAMLSDFEYEGNNVIRSNVKNEYTSGPRDYKYDGSNIIVSQYVVDSNNYDKYQYTSHDDKKTFIAAIHGLDNVLALAIFDCKDLYNNTLTWEQHRMSTTADGQKFPYNQLSTSQYQYNSGSLPTIKYETLNGIGQTTYYIYDK
ncbi:MAG: hypothetical protein EOP51_21525 [Sphingobacteriales bacterium]|nr:MAG: hypothetical protein EOP51_21525 [Sphingobacteriales bacterium]